MYFKFLRKADYNGFPGRRLILSKNMREKPKNATIIHLVY
jgi:hypothetical protein